MDCIAVFFEAQVDLQSFGLLLQLSRLVRELFPTRSVFLNVSFAGIKLFQCLIGIVMDERNFAEFRLNIADFLPRLVTAFDKAESAQFVVDLVVASLQYFQRLVQFLSPSHKLGVLFASLAFSFLRSG